MTLWRSDCQIIDSHYFRFRMHSSDFFFAFIDLKEGEYAKNLKITHETVKVYYVRV